MENNKKPYCLKCKCKAQFVSGYQTHLGWKYVIECHGKVFMKVYGHDHIKKQTPWENIYHDFSQVGFSFIYNE